MLKSLGFIETRSLTGIIAAADIMLKNTDIEIIGKEHLASGEVILIIQGETSSVNLALNMAAEKARELGQLKLSYIIPKPKPELEALLIDLLTPRNKRENESKKTLTDAYEKREQTDQTETKNKKKIKTKLPEHKKVRSVEEINREDEQVIKIKEDGDTVKEAELTNLHSQVLGSGNIRSKKVKKSAGANNFSLFDQSNDTISRLRKEALGTDKFNNENEPEIIETQNKLNSAPGKIKNEAENHIGNEFVKVISHAEIGEDIMGLNVHKLRKLARTLENFPIKGREISRANRNELIDHFNRIK